MRATRRVWVLAMSTMVAVSGCLPYPGMDGEECNTHGLCATGLACVEGRCQDACLGKQCGGSAGVDCGGCDATRLEVCEANQCIETFPASFGEYVRISAGTFTMGSPAGESGRSSDEEEHTVTLTRDYWLKATEVTQGEWRAVMETTPSSFSSCGDTCPVERVSWDDSVAYVNALSATVGLPPCYSGSPGRWTFAGLECRGFRLPTEAEWEYAARAGTTGPYAGASLDALGWYSANAGSTTHPVAGKEANAWGLYDVHGNVFEWVHDWYASSYGGAATDPLGPSTGSGRVLRGGAWNSDAGYCRSANRVNDAPANRYAVLGLRPARSIP